MSGTDSSIFRKAALERLASPEKLDARPALPAYPWHLAAGLALLAVAVIAFAAWLR
jgi:hypothetical protein